MSKFKISNSGMDAYNRCPRYYKFRYIENVKGDYTSSALLFGSAMDEALNYILESMRDKKPWNIEDACNIFGAGMDKWKGQNRLDFFKNDVPEELKDTVDEHNPDHCEAIWDELNRRGIACLFVYDKEIVPLIDEVISVQDRFEVPNDEGDTFSGVVDFIAKLKDGRTVLLDNKTASAKYPKNKVVKSQQLSLYMDQFPEIKYAGYIVLIKNPAREKGMTFQFMVDEIPEETIAASYKLLDETMRNIKEGKFDCNFKGCKAFGKECEYARACAYGDYTGLIPARDKKPEEST